MTRRQAMKTAARLSIQYGVWYVRDMGNGEFEPWAHHSDDERTVHVFMNGEEFFE